MTASFAELCPRDDAVDLAAFGRASRWSDGGAGGIQASWNETRDVEVAVATFARAAPPPARMRVEWWASRWPDLGTGGWARADDPWHGRWLAVHADAAAGERAIAFRFRPLAKDEHPDASLLGFRFRRTYSVRVAIEGVAARDLEHLSLFGSAIWKRAALRVELGGGDPTRRWDAAIEMANGAVEDVAPLADAAGARIGVRYAEAADRTSHDRGALTVRAPDRSFSCFVDDVVREGGLWIRGVDAFVSADSFGGAGRRRPPGAWPKPIAELVADLPEQTRARAMSRIPAKPPVYAPLGVPGGRHEFLLEPNGDVTLWAGSLRTQGPDRARRGWDDPQVRYAIATGEAPDFATQAQRSAPRELEDGALPLVRARWLSGAVEWTQTAFATWLAGALGAEGERSGAEPLVCFVRLECENRTARAEWIHVWLRCSHRAEPVLAGDGLLEYHELPGDGGGTARVHTLARFEAHGGATQIDSADGHRVLHHARELAPGERACVDVVIPYLQLLDASERSQLRALSHEDERRAVEAFWRAELARGMQIETPDPVVDAFYRSNLWRVLVSIDRDPGTGLWMAPAATVGYDVFANETCMIARSLEMRGLHHEAAQILEPFFRYQGMRALPGRFSGDSSGVFYSAGDYTHLPYVMHHGFVLWAAGEHFLWTGDRAWLAERAPALIRGCDWITRERRATQCDEEGRRAPEWGLLPASQLEDVEEWQYWYATNAYHALGLATVADALRAAGHPEAKRIAEDARDFRDDVLASAEEMWARTPAVKLLDGSFVPYLPARVYARTHRTEGWIRESLYCALHLWEAGLYAAGDPRVTWMLLDLEDNVFPSAESGYRLEPLEEKWFDWSGFCPQPCLLGNALAHLARGERKAFLRVFWNVFAASLYPDTLCFAEWIPEHGRGGGPLYKTPDECKFVQWLRLLLVREEGDALHLCSGLPSAWLADGCRTRVARAPTQFGEMGFELRSELARDRLIFRGRLPQRRRPGSIALHLPHPGERAIRRVVLDGLPWRASDAAAGVVALPPERDEVELTVEY